MLERVNARYLTELLEPVSLASIDVSFISLRLIFPVVGLLLEDTGEVIALVKPQLEAGREQVGKKGVVSNPDVHRTVLANVVQYAEKQQFSVAGLVKSPLTGPAGNVEFLLHLLKSPASGESLDIGELIRVTVEGG